MQSQTPQSSVRVLVVDDHVDTVDTIALLFEALGASVDRAYSGTMAIERARVANPDLILLDLAMPHMDGYEVAAALQDPPLPSEPVLVALSGFDQPSDKARSAEVGFDVHLAKPVAFDVLEQLLETSRRSDTAGPPFPELHERAGAVRNLIVAHIEMAATMLQVSHTTIDAQTKERCLQKAHKIRRNVANRLMRPPLGVLSLSPLQFVAEHALDGGLNLFATAMGNLQLIDQEGLLRIQAQRGFEAQFLQYFETVDEEDGSACAIAVRDRAVVAIEDVQTDERFAKHRRIASLAHFQAVISAPLIAPSGRLLGMLSVHFDKAHPFDDWDIQTFQRHASQAAAAIDWALV